MKGVSIRNIVLGSTFFCLLFTSCNNHNEEAYSFFVAGHSYGSPSDSSGGLHPPFLAALSDYTKSNSLHKGFLTGDIVKVASTENWDLVDADLNDFDIDVEFIAGNHDCEDLDLFESRYGKTFRSFVFRKDLFVILDGNRDHWNTTREQLTFLKESIAKNSNSVENIFVFVHQVIYYDFLPVTPNSYEGKADKLNYESDVKPLLESVNNPVYLFAGDVGAFEWGPSLYHRQVNNVTYLASGMGSGTMDNFLVVEVSDAKEVRFKIISLDGQDLGELESYH